jgi:Calcium binding
MKGVRRKIGNGRKARARISGARLAEMIEEATVDAYDEGEQMIGWFTAMEENLAMPFETEILGVIATVKRLELRDDNAIVAICARGSARQAIGVLDLPMPSPQPAGWEWLEAYRHWLRGR